MPTILTHTAVPLALRLGLGKHAVPTRWLWAGMVLSILPDLDMVFLYFGVPWHSVYGHRGFSHSFGFALMCAILFVWVAYTRKATAFMFAFAIVASHALLDTLSWGGQGVALYWPFSDIRIRAPQRPIPASPLDVDMFMRWGLYVLEAELKWVWLPLMTLGGLGALWRRWRSKG